MSFRRQAIALEYGQHLTPVVTAKGDEDSEVRVFEYGASDYLTKPFRPRALSARLHSLLARGHRAV